MPLQNPFIKDKALYSAGLQPELPDIRDELFHSRYTIEEVRAVDEHLLPLHVPRDRNQGSLSTCVPFSIKNALRHYSVEHELGVNELSALFLYNVGRHASGIVETGEAGMMIRNALKTAQKYGICLESTYPYTHTWNVDQLPPEKHFLEALNYRIGRYQAVVEIGNKDSRAVRVHKIKSALLDGFPVIVGFGITNDFYELSGPWRKQNYRGWSPVFRPSIGGHATVINGFSGVKARGQNQWGPEWGDNGLYGIYLSMLVAQPNFTAWVIRGFRDHTIREKPGVKLENLSRYNLEFRIVPEKDIGLQNIWIAAVDPTGRTAYAVDQNDQTVLITNSGDLNPNKVPVWMQKHLKVGEPNWFEPVQKQNLRPFAGYRVFVAYGQTNTLSNATIEQVCTIPENI